MLAVVGLVASLVAGIGVLFIRPLLTIGVWCSRFLLRWRSSHEWSNDARLLKDEPEVSHPQDQINKAESLEEKMKERMKVNVSFSILTNRYNYKHRDRKTPFDFSPARPVPPRYFCQLYFKEYKSILCDLKLVNERFQSGTTVSDHRTVKKILNLMRHLMVT